MNRNINNTEISKNVSFFMALPAFVWLLIFLYGPLFIIIGLSFIRKGVVSAWPDFTWAHYFTFFDSLYYGIVARSLLLALVTTVVCLLCAYPIAYFLALYARRWKNVLLYLLVLPFGVNFVILAYAWFFLLEKNGLINNFLQSVGIISAPIQLLNTGFAVYIGMIYCYLPFMILPIYAVLEKLDFRLIDASLDLGATRFATFWYVVVPQSMPGIQTGFFMVFIPSFGEYVVPALMGGGKYMYVGSLISHYFSVLRNLHLGSAFTVLSSIVLLLVALFFYWRFRKAA